MAKYFNSNDLLIRRVNTSQWLCEQTKKLTNMIKYGELVNADFLIHLEYVVAAMEACGCYEPITSEAEDGVKNCLTEAQLENLFNNISEVTGLCWHGKNVTYRNEPTEPDGVGQITSSVTLSGGGVIQQTNPVYSS